MLIVAEMPFSDSVLMSHFHRAHAVSFLLMHCISIVKIIIIIIILGLMSPRHGAGPCFTREGARKRSLAPGSVQANSRDNKWR